MPQQDIHLAVTSWLGGNETCFEIIYYHYQPKLYRYAYKFIHSHNKAEELTTDILVKLWQNKTQLTGSATFENYLFTIARNMLINEWRKKVDALLSIDAVNDPAAHLPEPGTYKQLENTYHETLSNFPTQRRKIFIMHREENLSYKEIADQLDISPKTVENHIVSALKQLRIRLAHFLYSAFL